jgi:hypothetical protein
MRIKKLLRW